MKSLPEISGNDLLIWDDEHGKCAGFLNKKASQSSAFSRGKWQKRWFVIEIDIDETENYSLQYFHGPDDKAPRQTFPLASSTTKITNDTTFVINFADGTSITLGTDSTDAMKLWVQTLEKAITVANLREKLLDHFERMSESSEPVNKPAARGTKVALARDDDDLASQGSQALRRSSGANSNAKLVTLHRPFPMIRIDVDLSSMPPSSAERHQFIGLFARDLANALHVEEDVIQILSLRSAPGSDWMTLVELNLNLHNSSDPDLEDDEQTHATATSLPSNRSKLSANSRSKGGGALPAHSPSTMATLSKRDIAKRELLRQLYNMVRDSSSALYMGYMTSKIDPTYSDSLRRVVNHMDQSSEQHLLHDLDAQPATAGDAEEEVELFSNDARTLQIMHKYKDVDLSSPLRETTTVQDMYTHLNTKDCFLEIFLYFEDRIGKLRILNPHIFPDRDCVIYVFEVQQALGMLGTLQETHLRPTGLIPRTPTKNMVKQSRNPMGAIAFRESVRHDGLLLINNRNLIGCQEFDVECEDERDEIFNSLSKEEMSAVKETFQQLEMFNMTNASASQEESQGVNIVKYEEIMHDRVGSYYTMIEEQYQRYIEENHLAVTRDTPSHHVHYIEEEMKLITLKKQQFVQSLQEFYMRFVLLLHASNVFGTNHISFTEFILIETWWLRCAVHPQRAHLF